MKSFSGARPYIFVDPQHIKAARKWLSKNQRDDGCIRSVGKLFHNGMKVWNFLDFIRLKQRYNVNSVPEVIYIEKNI